MLTYVLHHVAQNFLPVKELARVNEYTNECERVLLLLTIIILTQENPTSGGVVGGKKISREDLTNVSHLSWAPGLQVYSLRSQPVLERKKIWKKRNLSEFEGMFAK